MEKIREFYNSFYLNIMVSNYPKNKSFTYYILWYRAIVSCTISALLCYLSYLKNRYLIGSFFDRFISLDLFIHPALYSTSYLYLISNLKPGHKPCISSPHNTWDIIGSPIFSVYCQQNICNFPS